MSFYEKDTVIVGASGGLGKSIALSLAEKDMFRTVHLVGRNLDKMEQTASEMRDRIIDDSKVFVHELDLTDEKKVIEFLDKNINVDMLVNSAGVFPIKNISNSTLEDYQQCFDVNVRAPFLFCKKYAEQMKEKKWGRIVNVGSSSAYNGSADTGLYCASKHALLGLTRSLYQELKPYNVRVYSVCPGSLQTEMGAKDIRQDYTTFIDPREVADYITEILTYNSEMIPEEIRLSRMIIK